MAALVPCPYKSQHRNQLLHYGNCPVCGDGSHPLSKGGVSCSFVVEYELLGLGQPGAYYGLLNGLRLRHGFRRMTPRYRPFEEKDLAGFENDL